MIAAKRFGGFQAQPEILSGESRLNSFPCFVGNESFSGDSKSIFPTKTKSSAKQ